MSNRTCLTVASALAMLVASQRGVRAEQPAATCRLPAAAAALGIQRSDVVSQQEADAVRGSGLSIDSSGVAVQMVGYGQLSGGALALAGVAGGQTVTVAVDPYGLRFRTEGTAVIGDHSRVQGTLATGTGVFNGYLTFQGNPSALSVIAVPGMFAADFR